MACGFSPNLVAMLEQMAHEKEKTALEAERALEATTQHVARTKHKIARAFGTRGKTTENDNTHYDWTKTYEKWDAWEDPEDLARQEQDARARSERAAKAQMGCNHDHSAEQKLMDMTTTAKLAACDELRVLGNRFFQHGQYQRASYHYHKALVHFEYIFPDTDDENQVHDALKLKILLNFAASRLKTNDLDDVVNHATQALKLAPNNVKALYRRAQAHRLRDDFGSAQEDLAAAFAASAAATSDLSSNGTTTSTTATDPLLLHERSLLHAKMLAYKLRSRQVSSAMFQRNAAAVENAATQRAKTNSNRLDASVLRPTLLRPTIADTSSSNSVDTNTAEAAVSFESWQPSTFGLDALERVLVTLRTTE